MPVVQEGPEKATSWWAQPGTFLLGHHDGVNM